MQKLSQVSVQLIIIIAVAYGLGRLPNPGLQYIVYYLTPFWYTLFGASTVCSLHGYRGGAAVVFLMALVVAYPNLQDAGRYAISVGTGIIIGNILRQTLRKRDDHAQPE